MRKALTLSALVAVGCARGADPSPIVAKHVVDEAPAAAPPSPARWASLPLGGIATARLATSEGEVLAMRGRRALRGPSGYVSFAVVDLPHDVLAIHRGDGRFYFLTRDGATHVSTTPVGPIAEVRPSPLTTLAIDGAAGRNALVVLGKDGAAFRSEDGGKNWTALPIPRSPHGTPAVGIDRNGHGLALFWPQQLFVTADDGVTWKPLATTGNAPRSVVIDGADRIRTIAFDPSLPDALLDPATSAIAPTTAPIAAYPTFGPNAEVVDGPVAVGTTIVRILEDRGSHARSLFVGPLGGPWVARTLPAGYRVGSLAGSTGHLWIATNATAGITLRESTDLGVTWSDRGRFDAQRFVVGPGGSAIVLSNPPMIRLPGSSEFVGMTLPSGFSPHLAAVDPKTSRLWLSDKCALMYGPLARDGFVGVPAKKGECIAADELRTDHAGHAVVLRSGTISTVATDATIARAEPFDMRLANIEFADAEHALIKTLTGPLLETNDGGATYYEVLDVSAREWDRYLRLPELACTPGGCALREFDRIGWGDANAKPRGPNTPGADEPLDLRTKPPPKEVACVASAKPRSLDTIPTWIEGADGSLRWAGYTFDKGAVMLTLGALDGTVTTASLLPPAPAKEGQKPPALIAERLLVARVTSGGDATDLARYALSTKKVEKKTVAGDAYPLTGSADGVLAWVAGQHVVINGVESSIAADDVTVVSGSTVVGVAADKALVTSAQGAKTSTVLWNIGKPDAVVSIAGRPFAVFKEGEDPLARSLLALDALTVDPPMPVTVRLPPKEERCAATDRGLLVRRPTAGTPRFMTTYNGQLHGFGPADILWLVRADGSACLRGYAHDRFALISVAGGELRGWAVDAREIGPDAYRYELRTVQCK